MGHFFRKRKEGSQGELWSLSCVCGWGDRVSGALQSREERQLGEWPWGDSEHPPDRPQGTGHPVCLRPDSFPRYLMAGPDSSSEDEGGPHGGSSGDEAPQLPQKVRCPLTSSGRVYWEEDMGLL